MSKSKPINLDALRRKANPSFIAVKPADRKFGFDYLPPMNAGLVNLAPVRHPMQTAHLLAKAGDMPANFDWANPTDVAVKRMKGKPADAKRVATILKPLNQLACGSCWAFSSSSVLADRYTLFQGLKNGLTLSPTYLLSCSQGSQEFPDEGCDGGFPSSAGLFFENKGIPTWACQDYGWCPTSENATNSDIPSCNQIGDSCYKDSADGSVNNSTKIPQLYKAVQGSTQALPNPEAIKAELWHNGPVVGTFVVFSDFIGRDRDMTNKPGWVNTSNIYINMGAEPGLYSGYSPTQKDGGHAVVITGWGLEPNIKGLPADVTSKLKTMYGGCPYWIVRNSWGTQWNGNGFFKMAMSVPDLGINMTCGLDRIISVDAGGGQTYNTGGGTTFLPMTPEKSPKIFVDGAKGSSGPNPRDSGGGGGGSSSGGSSDSSSSSNFWTQPGGISVIVVCSVLFIAIIAITAVKVVQNKKKKALGR